ncbi:MULTISPECIES: DUF1853 family protein [unclassified Pseudomonas]|uniref:DUF1853 family protein n=1 Tax=unclassified Pseudomonas TaxID=196821 RepID=UPI000D3B7D96|nr:MULTISPECIES: DUF1853 family protein [unclassified Pseudomonas]RAU44127.1 DUF1853 family protein [Pseudomonas sp. RIT 409]RAU54872.1 DUF1853 family protein [Pseudomonas sp. RIT 412]
MTPFPTLTALPRQLRTAQVRDLAWVMVSPPMLSLTEWPQRHPLAGSDWVEDPQALTDFLHRLDRDPQPLSQWLSRRSIRRLGLYYEHLWQFAIEHAPGVELVAANLPIRVAHHTLGELDMLVRDKGGVHHIELAIKFYLGPQQADGIDPMNWLGPGSHDRLGAKLAHLNQHQLPMSGRPESREALAVLEIEEFQTHLWMGGYLLYPWQGECRSPVGAHPAHLRGQWLHQKDWPAFIEQRSPQRWQWVPRAEWLAPARVEAPWQGETVAAWLPASDPQAHAQLMARLAPTPEGHWEEAERVFVVPDHWPLAAEPGQLTGSAAPPAPPG